MAAVTCSKCGQMYPERVLNDEGQCPRCAPEAPSAETPAEGFPGDTAEASGATTPAVETAT